MATNISSGSKLFRKPSIERKASPIYARANPPRLMDESPFDLKLLPDWLKEDSLKNPYANFEGEEPGRERRDRREDRPRPKNKGTQGGPPPRDDRNRGGGRGPANKGRRPDDRREQRPAPQQQRIVEGPPVEVAVELLPDPQCLQNVIKQVQGSNRAFPLFGLARMFLEKPERHRVKITSRDAARPLWQGGEQGPLTLDRSQLESSAFAKLSDRYYTKESIQKEPLKGSYSNVARCRLSGTILGPTNHHSYQTTLRKLYEERFQRRMSFPDYQREIDKVTDPAGDRGVEGKLPVRDTVQNAE